MSDPSPLQKDMTMPDELTPDQRLVDAWRTIATRLGTDVSPSVKIERSALVELVTIAERAVAPRCGGFRLVDADPDEAAEEQFQRRRMTLEAVATALDVDHDTALSMVARLTTYGIDVWIDQP